MKLTDLRMLLTGIVTTHLLVSCGPYPYYEATPYEPQFIFSENYTYCFDDQADKVFVNVPYDYTDNYTCVEPVYLNQNVLRNVVGIDYTTAKKIEDSGQLYGYENARLEQTLYTVDKYNGIGIWDLHSTPTVQIGYLSIPGVTNLSISNDYLYANSYMDLVRVDLEDSSTAPVRLENVFQYNILDASLLLPANTYFYQSDIDVTKGVIIGYKQTGSTETILF